jgi:IS4 transposase
MGKSLYHDIINSSHSPYGKDAVYEFLKCEKFNWRYLLLSLSIKILDFIDKLSNKEKVLVLDDSALNRSRSKKVELLTRVFDHSDDKYLRGFRLLSLCWSDGTSLLPLDFALLSSRKEDKRYQGIIKEVDKRSCGYKRRLEALSKSTDLVEPMVNRLMSRGINAQYLLMDSGYAWPALINQLREHIHVICMARKMETIHYYYDEKWRSLNEIYRLVKKRPGRARILSSALVTLKGGQQAKLVFVRDRRKKDWLSLLTTDTSLDDSEVVRLYGKRWEIEVFFKMSKQHLGLEKGVQTRDFDSQIAYVTIVMLRALFLSLEQRRQEDPRTLGSLFRACCQEMQDLSFLDSLQRILRLAVDRLRQSGEFSERVFQRLISAVYGTAIEFLGLDQELYQRCQRVKL